MEEQCKQPIPQKDEETLERKKIRAQITLQPSYNAAMALEPYTKMFGEQNMLDLADELAEKNNQLIKGDLSCAESMLFNQAHALQAIFTNLSRRAITSEYSEYMDNSERYLRLALKAQAQCSRTLEVLGNLKNPTSIALVRQANIGQAVQVNNGIIPPPTQTLAHARENLNSSNELLEEQDEQRLDTRTTSQTSCHDWQMEPVK